MTEKKSALRPVLLWGGAILDISGNLALETGHTDGYVATLVGTVMALIGCNLWTREKNRAWGFMLWGLLAPVGYLGIMFLKDKTPRQPSPFV